MTREGGRGKGKNQKSREKSEDFFPLMICYVLLFKMANLKKQCLVPVTKK